VEVFGGQTIETFELMSHGQLDDAIMQSLDGLRVLLAEDYKMNQDMATEVLEMYGIDVTVANNGQEACEILQNSDKPFDLVLMDVQMPVMDGYHATSLIRQWDGFADLPIIALTASAMTNDVKDCMDAGMSEHVAKPIDFVHLLKLIAQMTGRTDSRGKVITQTPDNPDERFWFPDSLEGFDLEAGLKRLQVRKASYLKMLVRFPDGTKDLMEKIRLAIREDDLVKARELVHGMTGVAGNLDAVLLYESALALEKCLVEEDQKSRTRLLKAFESALKITLKSIEEIQPKIQDNDRQRKIQNQMKPSAAIDDLRNLLNLLRNSEFSAEQAFEDLKPALPDLMTESSLKKLEQVIADLKTQDAADIVEESLNKIENRA